MNAYEAEALRKIQQHYSFEEAAKLLSTTTKTLRRVAKEQNLRTHRIAGTKLDRIPQSELLKIIELVESGKLSRTLGENFL